MAVTSTISKKALEKIVSESFEKFGRNTTCALLDTLKLMGFYYATGSGLSISIDDLKIPKSKDELLKSVQKELDSTSEQWDQGYVSELERFTTIIESWAEAANLLKDKITEFYDSYDPMNSLYMMSSSGARGSMTQVRQLIGMRGLMSDQEGNIINLPIKANFREGLSLIDYLISAYGARKGVVDTALKTAEAGYLTRRLVFVAQDLIIKEIDCKATKGIGFTIWGKNEEDYQRNKALHSNPKTLEQEQAQLNIKKLLGRIFLKVIPIEKFETATDFLIEKKVFDSTSPKILTEEKLQKLKNYLPNRSIITVRTPLTCESKNTICQFCYGFDFAQKELVQLGKPVGLLAAQSIGEPGTQLTMRTFHTGGVATSQAVINITAQVAGKFIMPSKVKTTVHRTNRGLKVYRLEEAIFCMLKPTEGEILPYHLPVGVFLHIIKTRFIAENEIIAEFPKSLPTKQKIKSVLAPINAKVYSNLITTDYTYKFLELDSEKITIKELLKKKISKNDPRYQYVLKKQQIINRCKQEPAYKKEIANLETRFKSEISKTHIRPFFDYKLLKKNEVFWLASGQICNIPKESQVDSHLYFYQKKSIAKLKIIAPIEGIFFRSQDNTLSIKKEKKKKNFIFNSYWKVYKKQTLNYEKKEIVYLPLDLLKKKISGFSFQIFCLKENFERVEKDSILAYIYIFPCISEPVHFFQQEDKKDKISFSRFFTTQKYTIKHPDTDWELDQELIFPNLIDKQEKIYTSGDSIKKLFILSESDIWRINSDDISSNLTKTNSIHFGQKLTENKKIAFSGRFLKKDGFKIIVQRTSAVLLTAGSLVKCRNGEYLFRNYPIGKVYTSTQQASDITQGLPKIEKYIEASKAGETLSSNFNYMPGLNLLRLKLGLPTRESNVLQFNIQKKFSQTFDIWNLNFTRIKIEKDYQKNNDKGKPKVEPYFTFHDYKNQKSYYTVKKDINLTNINFTNVKHKTKNSFLKKSRRLYLKKGLTYELIFRTEEEINETNNLVYDILSKLLKKKGLPHEYNKIKSVIKKEERKQKKKLELLSIENRKLYKINSFDFLQLESHCKLGYLNGEIRFFYAVKNKKCASNMPNEYVTFLESGRYSDYLINYPISWYKDDDKKNNQRFRDVGLNLKSGIIGSDFLMQFLCNYYKSKYDFYKGNKLALLGFRILWVKGINSIYEEQGVNIALKHFELVICQMTKKALVLSSPRKGILSFFVYEKVSSSYLMEITDAVKKIEYNFKEREKELKKQGNLFELSLHKQRFENLNLEMPRFIPVVMASSKAALEKRGFFSAAGFQETKNVLLKAAVEGKKDWFQGLKESIIIGKLIPAGTSFLTQRYSLDCLYFYQKKKLNSKF
jgi:DNA-directed RNA polymerase beta' subunit